jgi:predicted nucleic acid-binding protein
MIVVDTSVWIDHFNGMSTRQTALLRSVLRARKPYGTLFVADLVVCETLQGARSDAQARVIEQTFRRLRPASLLDPDLAIAAASNYRVLRAAGITISSAIDVMIATFCLQGNHALLHSDGDFDQLEKYLDLKVAAATWEVNESTARYLSH